MPFFSFSLHHKLARGGALVCLIGGIVNLVDESQAGFYQENKAFFEVMQSPADPDEISDFDIRVLNRVTPMRINQQEVPDEVVADIVIFDSFVKFHEWQPNLNIGNQNQSELRRKLRTSFELEKELLYEEETLIRQLNRMGRWADKNAGNSEEIDLLTDWERIDAQLFGDNRKPIEPSFWRTDEEFLAFSSDITPSEEGNAWHLGDPRQEADYEYEAETEETLPDAFGADDPSFFADLERVSESLQILAESSIHGERIPLRLGDTSFYNNVKLSEKATVGINVSLAHPSLSQDVKPRVYRDSMRKSLVSSFESLDTLGMESDCYWLTAGNTAIDLQSQSMDLQICQNWQKKYREQEQLLDNLILLYAEYDSSARMVKLLDHWYYRWVPFGAQVSADNKKTDSDQVSFFEKMAEIIQLIADKPTVK